MDLLGDADDPVALAEALHATVHRHVADPAAGGAAVRGLLTDAVDDVEFVDDVLRSADICTADGELTATAVLRAAQVCAVVADRTARPPVGWSPVVTVPAFLEATLAAGRYTHTDAALRRVAAAAEDRLLIASPYLQARAVEILAAPVTRLTDHGGRVDVVTRALTGRLATRGERAVSDVNVAAVAALRTFAAPGRLSVTSWEGDRLGVHFKVVAADATVAYVGSANLTEPGAVGHAELGVVVTGAGVGAVVDWVDTVAAAIRAATTTAG